MALDSRKFKWIAFITVDVLLAVVIVALLVVRQERREIQLLSDLGVSLFPQPQVIQPFSLTDQDGDRFTDADLVGQWSLVFFGFSHCPNVCPLSLRELGAAQEEMIASGSDLTPRVIFATVDPARDTPARLRQYLEDFPGELVGLTGADDELAALAAQLYVVASKEDSHGETASDGGMGHEAGFNHSGHVSVINPEGVLVAAMQLPHRAEKITSALSQLDAR